MTDIVTGTVVHFKENAANQKCSPVFDSDTTKIGIAVNLPDGTDDCTAELAIFAKYISEIPDTPRGNPPVPVDRDRRLRLVDATKGWVRVIDLRRTHIPSIKSGCCDC